MREGKGNTRSSEDHARLFDDWAPHYDTTVRKERGFPFLGYAQVLEEIVRMCAAQPGQAFADMGTGTGELVKLLVDRGCLVWGVDFSHAMLLKAQQKVSGARWVQADLAAGWPEGLPKRVDHVVSSYALHHFPLEEKVKILKLWAAHVAPHGAVIVGDISFSTAAERASAQQRWGDAWDEEEFYWAADETLPALEAADLDSTYAQVSACAGIFRAVARYGGHGVDGTGHSP